MPPTFEKYRIDYTTPDGKRHEETVNLAIHSIKSVQGVWVDGNEIPVEYITYPQDRADTMPAQVTGK